MKRYRQHQYQTLATKMTDEGINETTDRLQPEVSQIRPDTAKLRILTFLFDLSPGGNHWKR